MSMCYWMIEGIGLEVGKIFVDPDKVIRVVSELRETSEDEVREQLDVEYSGDLDEFLENEFEPCGLASFLAGLDEEGWLTSCGNNDGENYLYYPPSFPWDNTGSKPKSIKDVHKRIIDVIRLVSDMSSSDIESLIDNDLYEVGMG